MNVVPSGADERPKDQRLSTASGQSTIPTTIDGLKELSIEEKDRVEELPALRPARPETPRRLTDPTSSTLLQPQPSPKPRSRSPYGRTHLRSASLNAPVMTRAHSSPTVMSPSGHLNFASTPRPSSPLRSPGRVRSPFKPGSDDSHPRSGAPNVSEIGIISEDRELNFIPRSGSDRTMDNPPAFNVHAGNTFPRQRRRPASPLHHSSTTPFGSTGTPSTPSQASPTLSTTKFHESFPPNISYPSSFSSSSVPSTPTSVRSRSPSISSLETIPDTPDAEEAAIEADRIAKLEAAAKAAEGGNEALTRSSLDVPRARNISFGVGNRDKRKRWSVCGAEKRGDLDLETIWED